MNGEREGADPQNLHTSSEGVLMTPNLMEKVKQVISFSPEEAEAIKNEARKAVVSKARRK